MTLKGDTERQATLRDRMIKRSGTRSIDRSRYISKILSALKPGTRLLDIGCGTAHIIQALATRHENTILVGLDTSPAMLNVAKNNTAELPNVALVEGDGLELPVSDSALDVVITRLAEYSPREAHRALKSGGHLFEYGLGPEANKEIPEFFANRIEKENFFFPENPEKWKEEACKDIKNAGFAITGIADHKESEYYQSEEDLMDLIEMVPLVKDFDRQKDRDKLEELTKKYTDERGIKITWHYTVIHAKRP